MYKTVVKAGGKSGGLVSSTSTGSTDETQPIKAGVQEFNSDGSPRGSLTPRASSYLAPPQSARAERSTDSQNRQSLLGLQPLNVEGSAGSGGSLLSPGTSKKVSFSKCVLQCNELQFCTAQVLCAKRFNLLE